MSTEKDLAVAHPGFWKDEIEAGDRHFRSVDLYQLLIYCALNFVSKEITITRVGLLNPRVGVFAAFDLDDLCDQCAGSSAAEVLDEVAGYISEPPGVLLAGR